jgi:hypothetical protein
MGASKKGGTAPPIVPDTASISITLTAGVWRALSAHLGGSTLPQADARAISTAIIRALASTAPVVPQKGKSPPTKSATVTVAHHP